MVTPRDKPNKPVVTMLCHKGPVIKCAVDPTGNYMITSSIDGTTRVWDIRKTYQQLLEIETPTTVSSIAISQKGLVALSHGDIVKVFLIQKC